MICDMADMLGGGWLSRGLAVAVFSGWCMKGSRYPLVPLGQVFHAKL